MNHRYVSAKERRHIGRVGAGIEHAGWILVPACRPHEMAIYRHDAMRGAWILGRGHACLKSQYPCGLQGRHILRSHQHRGPGR